MTTPVTEALTVTLKPCPFCNAKPKQGLTKVQHDQLHGEPFQRFEIWCPHHCARINRVNREQAISAWNQRHTTPTEPVLRWEAVERPKFPILGSRGQGVDWQLVADHGKQAYANHSQTVKRLAERGGLSWCEMDAVLHNRPWQKMDENEAMLTVRALEARYLAAIAHPPASPTAEVVEELAAAKAAIDEYYRYWTGGETRGSYDGKPERAALWAVRERLRAALAKVQKP